MSSRLTIPTKKSRKAILFIHGFACKCEQVQPFKSFFEKKSGIDVFVPMLKGHERDRINLKGIKAEEWVDQVTKWYDQLEAEYDEIVLCGYSMGALLVTHLMAKNKCSKVSRIAFFAPAFKHIWPSNLPKYTSKLLFKGLHNFYKTATIGKVQSKKVGFKAMRELHRLDTSSRELYESIKVPVSIYHMKGDCLAKHTNSKKLSRQLTKSPFVDLNLYPGGTHLIFHSNYTEKMLISLYNFIILDLADLNDYNYVR